MRDKFIVRKEIQGTGVILPVVGVIYDRRLKRVELCGPSSQRVAIMELGIELGLNMDAGREGGCLRRYRISWTKVGLRRWFQILRKLRQVATNEITIERAKRIGRLCS